MISPEFDYATNVCAAAAFGSKSKYLFGSIGMGIKLVGGNSAGTVTAYYVSNTFILMRNQLFWVIHHYIIHRKLDIKPSLSQLIII